MAMESRNACSVAAKVIILVEKHVNIAEAGESLAAVIVVEADALIRKRFFLHHLYYNTMQFFILYDNRMEGLF